MGESLSVTINFSRSLLDSPNEKKLPKTQTRTPVLDFRESLCNLFKIETKTQMFSYELCKIFRNIIFIEQFIEPVFITCKHV